MHFFLFSVTSIPIQFSVHLCSVYDGGDPKLTVHRALDLKWEILCCGS